MKEDGIEPACPHGRCRGLIAGLSTDLVAHWRHFGTSCSTGNCIIGARLAGAGRTFQITEDLVDALSARGADHRHGRAQFPRQGRNVDLSAALPKVVGQIQDRPSSAARVAAPEQPAPDAAADSSSRGSGARRQVGRAGHAAREDVAGNLFVLRSRDEAINPGQVDKIDLVDPATVARPTCCSTVTPGKFATF